MSGPNPPDEEPGGQPTDEYQDDLVTDTGFHHAYSAPELEHYTAGPYVAPDPRLYDYDTYDSVPEVIEDGEPPKWPWVVGVTAIIAAIALVVSVSLLVTSTDTDKLATPETTTTVSLPPVQDEITTTEPPPPPPPPPTHRGTAATAAAHRDGDGDAGTAATPTTARSDGGATASDHHSRSAAADDHRHRPGRVRSPTR